MVRALALDPDEAGIAIGSARLLVGAVEDDDGFLTEHIVRRAVGVIEHVPRMLHDIDGPVGTLRRAIDQPQ